MGARINAVGLVRGRLTCLHEEGNKVFCECECGNKKLVNRNHFLTGNTLSCGCLRDEKLKSASESHKMSKTRLYSIWTNMKSRCYNPNVECYKHYGGKGITICEEWMTFEGFVANLPEGYSDLLEIDRIDVNGNYTKSNCRWADRSTQCFNRNTKNRGVTYCSRDNLWRAKVVRYGKTYQKYFKEKEDAVSWREDRVKELYGD